MGAEAFWTGVFDELSRTPALLAAHVRLTLAALVTAAVISVPLGVVVAHRPRLRRVALGLASVVQTIPGLALLAVMVPLLSAVGLPGIGVLPAYLGLTAYCVLPILLNTVTGLAGVDPILKEAAAGVGMTPRQALLRVELPLAVPVIGGGMRTATVWCVGMATLSTPVGAPSLGNLIFTGLQTRNEIKVLVGCVVAAALAQLLDRAVHALQQGAEHGPQGPRRRRVALGSGLMIVVALLGVAPELSALATRQVEHSGRPERPHVVIGAKSFTEALILAEVSGQLLTEWDAASYSVRPALGSTVAFDALVAGQIDLMVDYTGTVLATIMKEPVQGRSRAEINADVVSFLRGNRQVSVLAELGFENAYVLVMAEDAAAARRVVTVGDAATHARELAIGADYEFFAREEWRQLEQAYGLGFGEQRPMDASLMVQALDTGAVDVIAAYSTDGRIDAAAHRLLSDPKGVVPPYDALLLARPGLCQAHPRVCSTLAKLDGRLSASTMRQLNRAVDQQRQDPHGVAAQFVAGLVAE